MLMTSAPMLVARTIPLARVASVEEALSLSSSFSGPYAPEVCRMLMSSASGAMPWKVSLGEGCAPMMLAMRVPWWSQSSRPLSPMT